MSKLNIRMYVGAALNGLDKIIEILGGPRPPRHIEVLSGLVGLPLPIEYAILIEVGDVRGAYRHASIARREGLGVYDYDDDVYRPRDLLAAMASDRVLRPPATCKDDLCDPEYTFDSMVDQARDRHDAIMDALAYIDCPP